MIRLHAVIALCIVYLLGVGASYGVLDRWDMPRTKAACVSWEKNSAWSGGYGKCVSYAHDESWTYTVRGTAAILWPVVMPVVVVAKFVSAPR